MASDLAKAMRRMYPNAKVIEIDMLYKKEVWEYVMKIEEAHHKAASSTLTFP